VSFSSFDQTLDHLRRRWSQANRAVLRHLFPLVAEGRPVSPGRLAEAARADVATAERTLVTGRANRDEEGNAVALFGIGHPPASNRIQVGPVCLFSCCALTAQRVPHLLSRTATTESVDPVGHRLVRLTSAPARIQSTEPSGASATLVVTYRRGSPRGHCLGVLHAHSPLSRGRVYARLCGRGSSPLRGERGGASRRRAPTHRGPLELSVPENARRVASPSRLTPSRGSLDGRHPKFAPSGAASEGEGCSPRGQQLYGEASDAGRGEGTASWIVTISKRPRQVRPQPRRMTGLQGSASAHRRRPAGCRLLVTERDHRIELRRAQSRVEAKREADQD